MVPADCLQNFSKPVLFTMDLVHVNDMVFQSKTGLIRFTSR
jgi:hypothetical protein